MLAAGADFQGVSNCSSTYKNWKNSMKDIVTLNLKSEFDRVLNEYTTGTLTFKILKIGLLKFYS